MADTSIEPLLKSLESKYLQGNYDAIIDQLLQHKSKFGQGLFHYNLGTLHIKNKDYAVGRFHLEKALRKGFLNTKTLKNLKAAKYHLRSEGMIEPKGIINTTYSTFMTIPSTLYLSITLLFLLLATIYFFKNKVNKWAKSAVIILCLTPYLISKLYIEKHSFAIALKNVEVREGPSGIYPLSYELPIGSKVILSKPVNGWFYIKHPIEFIGWLKRDNLGIY